MKGKILIKKYLLWALLALWFVPSWANAASINFNPDSVFDFGNVSVGTTASQTVSVTFDYRDPEFFTDTSFAELQDPFTRAVSNCSYRGCDLLIQFAPTVAGVFTQDMSVILFFKVIGGRGDKDASISRTYTVTGTGISSVPVPAALPLLASGIGGLGLIGWRRKRNTVALD